MTYGQHLKRNRHGTLSFRFKVPSDLVAVFGRTELTIGLGTASKRDAMSLAAELKAITIKAVCAARATLMSDPKNKGKLTFKVGDLTFDASTLPVDDGKLSVKVLQSLVPKRQVNTLVQQAEQRAHADGLLRKFAAKLNEGNTDQGALLRGMSQIQAPPPGPAHTADDDLIELRRMRKLQGLQAAGGAIPVSELFKRYCDDHRSTWKNWADRVKRDYDPVRDTFISVIGGDMAVELLTIDHSSQYADHVRSEGTAKNHASSTMKKRVDFLKAVLTWGAKKRFIYDITGALGMEKQNESYEAFTPTDLKTLFECSTYRTNMFSRAANFWLPLLGLYTGARINELASIRLEHIIELNGVMGIQLSPAGKKSGKNEHSKRFMPVHPAIIDCGFGRYVTLMRSEGYEELFPCLPNAERDGKGKRASEEFIEFRRGLGIGAMAGEGRGTKTFHSFRSTLTTQMQNAGVPPHLRKELEGHASKDVHMTVYSQGQTPQSMLLDALAMAKFAFEHPIWHDTEPYRYARANGRAYNFQVAGRSAE